MKVTAKEMAALIEEGENIVFMTGAGLSTPSGIPDYRGMEGIYSKSGLKSPEYLLSRRAMLNDTDDYYAFVKQIYHPDALPNIIHQKMAALEETKNVTIITQNIDDLHRKAGSSKVIEFHGNIYHCHCERCKEPVSYQDFLTDYTHQLCGGLIRPNAVLYDEQIDQGNILESVAALGRADTIVIVGTTFRVYPFAGLIDYANKKARIYVVNKEPVYVPNLTAAFIGDATEVFKL